MAAKKKDPRRERGEAIRHKLWKGKRAEPSAVMTDIMDVSVEHLFGDIWTRPGLKLRDRSMITVTALMVLVRPAQLKVHLKGALNVGISRKEIKEMAIHLAHYGGWPASMTAMSVVEEVFKEVDAEARAEKAAKAKKKPAKRKPAKKK